MASANALAAQPQPGFFREKILLGMSTKEYVRSCCTPTNAVAAVILLVGIPLLIARFAFGLAASSFFPVIIMGVFWKRATKEGAMAGMAVGIIFTAWYIIYFKFVNPAANTLPNWWFAISPEGIGMVGMVVNFVVKF
mgnify:CR=1 FL=1